MIENIKLEQKLINELLPIVLPSSHTCTKHFVGRSALFEDDFYNILPFIQSKSISVICADLPYNTTKCKWDTPIDLDKLWEHYKRIIKDRGVIILFAQTPFDKILGASNIKWLKYEWIWEKTSATGHLNAKKMPMKAHENILVFYKKTPKFYPQKTYGHIRKVSKAEHKVNCIESDVYNKGQKLTSYDSTERYQRSVLKYPSDKQKKNGLKMHPTQKPFALVEEILKSYATSESIVLDNCMGSNTTGAVCKKLNIPYIGIEKENEWYNVSVRRVS
jgi:site-specific DNA-methyltransferase (adenine-specific)